MIEMHRVGEVVLNVPVCHPALQSDKQYNALSLTRYFIHTATHIMLIQAPLQC